MQTYSLPQLTLGFNLHKQATFHNFHLGKNLEIISTLRKAMRGEAERIIYLHAGRGQGLSHLLQACCHDAYQNTISSIYLPLRSLLQDAQSKTTPEVLRNLELLQVVCFDDIDIIAGLIEWEEAVFHLFNRIYDNGGVIIISAHTAPKNLPLKLPDLLSRLSWGIVYKLQPLQDEEKLNALIGRAHERGIHLSEEVARYILTHCPRHLGTLFSILDVLDKASLAAQRRLTIPFIKEVLDLNEK